MSPFVSVIIPTSNRATLVARAIRSVLVQSFKDLEIIVIDDASFDNTHETVQSFNDPRIIYIKMSEQKGAQISRNIGIKKARGQYIALLDDDDEWLPEKLQKQLDLYNNNNQHLGVVYTGAFIITHQHISKAKPTLKGNVKHLLFDGFPGPLSSTALIKKECFEKIGEFDEILKFHQVKDIWMRISNHFEFDYIDEYLTKIYTNHNKRISNNHNNVIFGMQQFLNKYYVNISNQYRAKLLWQMGKLSLIAKEPIKARNNFNKALRASPFKLKYLFYFLVTFIPFNFYSNLVNLVKLILKWAKRILN